MKKAVALAVVVFLLLLTCTGAFALEKQTLILFMDGKQITYKAPPVTLKLNGEVIESDVPPVILDGRTLVPVRVISESTGARVDWNGEKYEVTVTTADKVIKLKINSNEMLVNGERLTLDVPAKLINDRTMVPVRAITESLGLVVGWDASTYTVLLDYPKGDILDVYYSEEEDAVILETSGRIMYSTMLLQEPDRLVIDFPNTIFRANRNKVEVNNNNIIRVRASQFEVQPCISRVVLDLESPSGYSISYDEEKQQLKVSMTSTVKDISFDQDENRKMVKIDTSSRLEYSTLELEDPYRVVVDLYNASLGEMEGGEIPVDKDHIKAVRYSQFEKDIVRVVIDLDVPLQYNVESNKDGLVVYLDGVHVEGVEYAQTEWKSAMITIDASRGATYNIINDRNNKTLMVELWGDQVKLEAGNIYIDDNMVERIETVPHSKLRDASYVVLYLKDSVRYKVVSSGEDDKIALELSAVPALYQDTLIVIDPGHGGKDPGGIGAKGLTEKEVNLDISLRLKALLEEMGFKTLMTRTEDCFVDLYHRAEIANQANADLFVSVHINAHPSSSMYGVETLYYPSNRDEDDNRDNFTFARIMQEEMVDYLQTADRGLDPREKLVVIRETKMPAVIAELGFLTNKNEEALFMTDEYRQKCAQALSNGIKRYVDKVLSGMAD